MAEDGRVPYGGAGALVEARLAFDKHRIEVGRTDAAEDRVDVRRISALRHDDRLQRVAFKQSHPYSILCHSSYTQRFSHV